MGIIKETIGKSYTGACHCGSVTIEMKGPLFPFVICHCIDCLRTAGYTWAAAKIADEQLLITKGAEHVDWYASSDVAKRGFCKTCHAQMFYKGDGTPVTSVSVGMFDSFDDMHVAGHIYRSALPECCRNDDSLPDIDTAFYEAEAKRK